LPSRQATQELCQSRPPGAFTQVLVPGAERLLPSPSALPGAQIRGASRVGKPNVRSLVDQLASGSQLQKIRVREASVGLPGAEGAGVIEAHEVVAVPAAPPLGAPPVELVPPVL